MAHATAPTYDPRATDDADVAGITRTVARRYLDEGIGTQAAGLALFALIALPATLLALASIYGLVALPADVAGHVALLAPYLPPQVVAVLQSVLDHVTAASPRALTLTVVISTGFALLAAQRAMAATTGALDRLGRHDAPRSFWRRQLTALTLAITGILLLAAGGLALVALPWQVAGPAFLVAGILYLASVYHRDRTWSEMTWGQALGGAVLGGVLAAAASLGLSWWVMRAADYQALYGAFGSIVVLLIWAYLVGIGVLLGGAFAAEAGARRRAEEEAWNG